MQLRGGRQVTKKVSSANEPPRLRKTLEGIVAWFNAPPAKGRRFLDGYEGAIACAAMVLCSIAIYTAVATSAGQAGGKRLIVFPIDRHYGQLYTRPVGVGKSFEGADANKGWRYLAEAQGRVEIPANVELMLRLRERDLSFLKAFRNDTFANLNCANLGLRDEDAEYLRYATQLRALDLAENPQLTDRCLAYLAEAEKLEWLSLDGTGVSGSSVSANAFASMENLQYFSANNSPFEDAGVAHLSECTKLKMLQLERTMVTDESARLLPLLVQIEALSFADTRVGRGLLSRLGSLPQLRYLNVGGTLMTDSDVRYLTLLPQIRFVNLDRTRITNAALPLLQCCMGMQSVSVNGTAITPFALTARLPSDIPRIFRTREGRAQSSSVKGEEGLTSETASIES
jgi:hypothetical protein